MDKVIVRVVIRANRFRYSRRSSYSHKVEGLRVSYLYIEGAASIQRVKGWELRGQRHSGLE